MSASTNSSTPTQAGQLADLWAFGLLGAVSANFRRMISPWGYRHLRGLAITHYASGVFLIGLSAVLAGNGHPGWVVLTLLGTALHFAIGSAEIAVFHSQPSRA
jgi:hypothetical protein